MNPNKKLFIVAIIIACVFSFTDKSFAAGNDDITDAGDIVQILLPVIAFGSTFIAGNPDGGLWDKEGTYQATKSIGASLATMGIGKAAFDKLRPDGSDNSYPSGHTTAAFAGAGFIDTRYGHGWGVPSLLAAGFVAYSRVQSENHFADDCVAGASIGMMYNWLFVTPQSESGKISLLPMPVEGGAGLALTITDEEKKTAEKKVAFKDRRFRYNFLFGPAFLETNKITSPSGTGSTFDLADFEKINDPTSTAAIDFGFYLNDRNEISLFFSPFESRDRGAFVSPVSFAGRTFPANTEIHSDWLLYDLSVRWRYNLTPHSPWEVKVGGGLSYQYMELNLKTASGSVSAGSTGDILLPILSGSAAYKINRRLSAGLEAEGIYLSEDVALDVGVFVNYRISDRWDFTVGYKYYERDLDTTDLKNNVVYNTPYLGIAYSWLK